MSMVLEAKSKLLENGCNPELLDKAFKTYNLRLDIEQKTFEENLRLKEEIQRLKEEKKELILESNRFVSTVEVFLENIIDIDLQTQAGKEKFKRNQHNACKILNIIKFLQRISNLVARYLLKKNSCRKLNSTRRRKES